MKTHSLEVGESFEYDSQLLLDDGEQLAVRYVVTRREIPEWWNQDEMPVKRYYRIDGYVNEEKVDDLSSDRFTNYE